MSVCKHGTGEHGPICTCGHSWEAHKFDAHRECCECSGFVHGGSCQHCEADAKILGESIERVVSLAWGVLRADYPPLFQPGAPGQTLRDALRDLVREIRR